jgi:hypothetical protein
MSFAITPLLQATLILSMVSQGVRALDPDFHHLRRGSDREWSTFPEKSEGESLLLQFESTANWAEQTLRLRHRDLKFQWVVRLNGKDVALLPRDEMDMVTFWPLPSGTLLAGMNELQIVCTEPATDKAPDDVMIGDVALFDAPRGQVLGAASVDVTVIDADRRAPTPCRITVADEHGSLMSTGNASDKHLAVRPGIVYTGDGHATLSLPAGSFTLYAGRGFAYSLDLHPFK